MNFKQFTISILLAALCSGCGTIGNNDSYGWTPRPYGGLRTDYAMGTGNQLGCGPWWFLDMPFSLIGDTIALPFEAHLYRQIKEVEQSKTNAPGPDPLLGWKSSSVDWGLLYGDYMDYLNKLPKEEWYLKGQLLFLEDGEGRHAVRMYIPDPKTGDWWEHDLIYDQNNRRTQTIKRISGHFKR